MLIERLYEIQPRGSQAHFWINIKCFLYHIVIRGSGALNSQQILFNFCFSQPIGDAVFCSFRAILFLQTVFHLHMTNGCQCLLVWCLSVESVDVSGFQVPQLHFKETGRPFQGCFSQAHSSRLPFLYQFFLSGQYLLFTNFPF